MSENYKLTIMKELSIEEKAKRYDKALERAKNTIEVNQTIPDIVECVESLFPELKESEDERIKEDIITYLSTVEDKELIPYESWIAWLEKQDESNKTFNRDVEIEDEKIRKYLITYFSDIDDCASSIKGKNVLAWLEKQGKETSWKPSKEEMDVLYGLAYITNQYDEHKEEVITRLYQDLKREFFNGSSYENMFPNTEDGVRRRSTIQVLEYARSLDTYNQYGKADIDKNIAWLEKQGKQKVSEYDVIKTIKERIIEHFDNHLIIDKCFSIGGLKNDILKIINEVNFEKQGEQKVSVVDFKAKD